MAGYDALLIKGKAPKPVYIIIQDEDIQIKDASHLWGKNTIQTQDLLVQEYNDKKLRISCIGQAGENLVRFAAIANDYNRFAGRCGLGAVMGAKNLKAIAVRGTKKIAFADEEGMRQLGRELAKEVAKNPGRERMNTFGTNGLMRVLHDFGDVPINNWRSGEFLPHVDNVTSQAMNETILTGTAACRGCPIGCERIVEVKEGPYKMEEGKGPEYETVAAFGPLLLNDNLKAIAKGNELCTLYGLDTISAGGAIAFAFEAFEKGLITREDTDGLELQWGNAEAIVKLLHKIGKREDIGDILAEGARRAARRIGNGSEEFVIDVKGLDLPMHDPRAFNSWALVYSTCNRGACHISTPAYWIERGLTFPELELAEIDRFETKGKPRLVKVFQDFCEAVESLVSCKFSLCCGVRPGHLVQFLNYTTGWDFTLEELVKVGERSINLKRLINTKLGISRKEDRLPNRVYTVHTEGGAKDYQLTLEDMLDEYYQLRGWDNSGVPLPAKLKELDILES
jgi:aldehyde:ferredoxin oxidoreductase